MITPPCIRDGRADPRGIGVASSLDSMPYTSTSFDQGSLSADGVSASSTIGYTQHLLILL
jgi:hypothetical protein